MLKSPVVHSRHCDAGSLPSAPPANRLPLFTTNDLLWLLYLYPFRLLSWIAPRALLYSIGRLAEPLVQFHTRGIKEKAIRRMLAAPLCAITPGQAPRIARQSISNYMFRMLDDVLLRQPSFEHKLHCADLEGIGHLERAVSAGNGAILLVGHFCANRIAQRYLATLGYPILSVQNQAPVNHTAGRLGLRYLQPRTIELRRSVNPDLVYSQDPECSLKILQRLRSGGLVLIQLDGKVGARTVEGPFLGGWRRFPAGIFEIARLSGCAVVPMLCLGRSTGFRIVFSPMLDIAKAPSREEFVAANLPCLTQTLEQQIADYPEEWWLWTHI
jgi:lauroyl/myristoyl acyltransferase